MSYYRGAGLRWGRGAPRGARGTKPKRAIIAENENAARDHGGLQHELEAIPTDAAYEPNRPIATPLLRPTVVKITASTMNCASTRPRRADRQA